MRRVEHKLKEPYGLTLPKSQLRHITLEQSQQMLSHQQTVPEVPQPTGCDQLIVETDGGFIPVMTPDDTAADQRKNKTLG